MKRIGMQLLGLLVLMTYLGVPMAEAVGQTSSAKWIAAQDSMDRMNASFPHKPIEMTVDIPFKNTPAKGRLHLFTCSTETGVFFLSALSLPSIDEQLLQKEAFKQAFEAYLVPRLFYSPQLFHQNQTFSSSKSHFKGRQALSFQFSYKDKSSSRLLKGLATVREHTLYTLFYLATEANFKEADLQRFLQSFDLNELQADQGN